MKNGTQQATREEHYRQAKRANTPDAYRLPDHWILPLKETVGTWQLDHACYVKRVVEILRAHGASRVLEVGCGDGWNCGQLVERGFEAVGVDWSPNGIEHARRLVPGGSFYCGDVTDPQFKRMFPEPFDAVIFVEVLEHIPPEDTLRALRHTVAPLERGGVFVLTTPSVNKPNTDPRHYRHFDHATLWHEVGAVEGMRVQRIEGYGDAAFQRSFDRVSRWLDNRYYRIKPLKRWWNRHYQRRHGRQTPVDRANGLILVAHKER